MSDEKLTKDDKEDIKLGRALQVMMATEGWQHFLRLVNAHIKTVQADVLRPFSISQDLKAKDSVLFGALDHVLTSEAQKGAIMGLMLARDLPLGIINNMETLLLRAGVTNEDEDA